MAISIKKSRSWYPYALILFWFIGSRLIFYGMGGEFHYSQEIEEYFQYLDVHELKNNLWESILYLHAQPPLFNLWLGLSAKMLGDYWYEAFRWGYLVLGLAGNLLLFDILRQLDIRNRVAIPVILLFISAPSQLVYENLFFYAYPVAFLMTVSAWAGLRLLVTRKDCYAHLIAWTFVMLCLLRSSFHLVVFLLPAWLIYKVLGRQWLLRVLLVPFLIVFLWYAKNFAMFGFFGSSSWYGMNFARIALHNLSPKEKEALAERTKDPLATLIPFLPPQHYRPYLPSFEAKGPPVYTSQDKGKIGNYNWLGYPEVSRRYMRIALTHILDDPTEYAGKVVVAIFYASVPSERYYFAKENLELLGSYADVYDIIVWGSPYGLADTGQPAGNFILLPGLTVLFFFPVCLMILWMHVFQMRRTNEVTMRHWHFLGWMTALMLYCLIISSMVEIRENNRFRYTWEGLLIVTMTWAVFNPQRRSLKKTNRLHLQK